MTNLTWSRITIENINKKLYREDNFNAYKNTD